MKLRATKREIKENNYYILKIGYCELQYLLRPFEPFAYSCGVYGWNCDYYDITTNNHRIIISTGYAPIDNQNIKVKNDFYKIIRKYDDKARAINGKPQDWKKTQSQLKKLMYKFIDNEVFTKED